MWPRMSAEDKAQDLRTGPLLPPQAIPNPVNLLEQEQKNQVHRIASLQKAQDGWRGNGGHQTAGKFISRNGGVRSLLGPPLLMQGE